MGLTNKKKLKSSEFSDTLDREKQSIPEGLPELSGLTRVRYVAECRILDKSEKSHRAAEAQRYTLRFKRENLERLIQRELYLIVKSLRQASQKDAEEVSLRCSQKLGNLIKQTGFLSLKKKLQSLREITTIGYGRIGDMTISHPRPGTQKASFQISGLESND